MAQTERERFVVAALRLALCQNIRQVLVVSVGIRRREHIAAWVAQAAAASAPSVGSPAEWLYSVHARPRDGPPGNSGGGGGDDDGDGGAASYRLFEAELPDPATHAANALSQHGGDAGLRAALRSCLARRAPGQRGAAFDTTRPSAVVLVDVLRHFPADAVKARLLRDAAAAMAPGSKLILWDGTLLPTVPLPRALAVDSHLLRCCAADDGGRHAGSESPNKSPLVRRIEARGRAKAATARMDLRKLLGALPFPPHSPRAVRQGATNAFGAAAAAAVTARAVARLVATKLDVAVADADDSDAGVRPPLVVVVPRRSASQRALEHAPTSPFARVMRTTSDLLAEEAAATLAPVATPPPAPAAPAEPAAAPAPPRVHMKAAEGAAAVSSAEQRAAVRRVQCALAEACGLPAPPSAAAAAADAVAAATELEDDRRRRLERQRAAAAGGGASASSSSNDDSGGGGGEGGGEDGDGTDPVAAARECRILCAGGNALRYLRAREWSEPKALKQLRGSVAWGAGKRPALLDPRRFEWTACYRRGGMYLSEGHHDRLGRPVVYLRPRIDPPTVALFVAVTEQALAWARSTHRAQCPAPPSAQGGGGDDDPCVALPDVATVTWVVSLKGIMFGGGGGGKNPNGGRKLTLKEALSAAVGCVTALQNHYPERLGKGYLVDAPFVFWVLWKAISPFMSKHTKSKVTWVRGSLRSKRRVFEEFFDLDELEEEFGGNVPMPARYN